MKNSRGFIQIILILIVLVAIAGGAYYFGTKNKTLSINPVASVQPSLSPIATADPTVNWKTYTNLKYGFTVEYPKDFKVDENSDGVFTTIYKGEKVSNGPIDPYSKAISVTFAFRTDLSDPNDACFEYGSVVGKCAELTHSGTTFHKDIVTINNATGIIVQADDLKSNKYFYLKAESGRVAGVNLWDASPVASADNLKLLDQILSTFKFTK